MVSAPFVHSSTSEDIRPARQYRTVSKSGSKWEQLAPGGQNGIVLPLNPASMLVEPLVAHLAVAVAKSIDCAIPPTE